MKSSHSRAVTLIDTVAQCDLRQYVQQPTRGDNLLDLVLTNMPVSQCEVDDGPFESDHRHTSVTCLVPRVPPVRLSRSTALNYRRADFPGLRRTLGLLPWNIMDDMDVDAAVDVFYQWTEAAVADHIPRVTLQSKYPPWFDGAVRRALREKELAHRRRKLSPTPENVALFSDKRSAFKSTVLSKYRTYVLHIIDDFRDNSKRFWSLLKSVKSSGRTVPVLSVNGRDVTDDRARAECLNRTFASRFSDPCVDSLPDAVCYDIDNFSELTVTYDTVFTLLKTQNVHKACGWP